LGTSPGRARGVPVGRGGPLAMPGALPPSSGYPYAVDVTIDEAITAKSVVFSTPVSFYVQNFLNFPVGQTVPVGFYDRSIGQWVAADSGWVIKILSISGGLADVDSDGDGLADGGAAIGLRLE